MEDILNNEEQGKQVEINETENDLFRIETTDSVDDSVITNIENEIEIVSDPDTISDTEQETASDESCPAEQQQVAEAENEEAPKPTEIAQIINKMDALCLRFEEKIAYDTHKNALFDKMYSELSTYKNDIYQKIMKPIIMDMIMLLDDTNKIIRDIDKSDTEKVFKVLSGVPGDILDILERNGVEAYQDESVTFEPKTQRVLKTIPTSDIEMDNKVESSIRQGYKWDERVIKPEMINCYKYKQND